MPPKENTMLVSDYMSNSPVTISRDADYNTAFEIMETRDLHHLPVVDTAGQVVGILARRDLQLAARHFHEAPVEVAEVMHTPVVSVSPTAGLATAAKRMADHRIGCLPVVDRKKQVVGMLTETDLFRALADSLKKRPAAKTPSKAKAKTKTPSKAKTKAKGGTTKKRTAKKR